MSQEILTIEDKTANDLWLVQQGQTNGKQKQTSQGRGEKNGGENSFGSKKAGGITKKKKKSLGAKEYKEYEEKSLIGRKTKDGRALGEREVKYGGFF